MGIGNFFDNFMGGLAFGMLANLSYGFGRWGGGCGCWSFPMTGGFGYQSDQFNCLFDNSFQNSFPKFDFSNVGTSIWDNVNNSMADYIQMQSSLATSSVPLSTCNQMYTSYSMPFSSYYFQPFYMSYLTGYAPAVQQKAKSPQQSLEPTQTDTEEAKQKNAEKTNNAQTENSGATREFATIYKNLGITDKRFQKIFEECVLSINEGRKRGEDYNIFDVKAMNKNGVLQTTYDEYRVKEKHLPKRDVKNMTLEEMCDIYYTMFYVKGGAKDIKDDRLALYVFDSDVNMGVGTGKNLLSKSGNDAKKFEEERRIEYSRRKNFNTYKKTWYNRIENTKKYADNNFTAVA